MDRNLTTSFELLELRLALMRDLAGSLQQVQTAVVRSDRREIDRHTTRQRELCESLRQIESEALRTAPRKATAGESRKHEAWMQLPEGAVSPELGQRWKNLAQELTEVELQVGQLNRVYAALLRRAQCTVQIFMRVLASSANTYARPKYGVGIAASTLQEVSHV
jgi:hypothetical protein